MSEGWICSICSQAKAVSFCLCSTPESMFCSSCMPIHHSKYPSTHLHNLLPIVVYGVHRSPGFFERFQDRQRRLNCRKDELMKGVEAIAEGIEKFTSTMTNYTAAMIDYAHHMEKHMREETSRLEEEIRAGIAEAEQLVCFEQPKVTNRWADFILNANEFVATPKVFRYSVNTSRNFHLETILNYTCAFDFEVPLRYKVPAVTNYQLRMYDLVEKSETTGKLDLCFTRGMNYCWVSDELLLCVGGSPAVSTAYGVNVNNSNILKAPSMTSARSYSGILNCGVHVYVFGGYSPNLKSCETFDSYDNTWRALGDMNQVRACFNPTRHRNSIYLFESYISQRDIEVFNLATEEFSLTAIQLSSFPKYSLSFVIDDVLVIVADYEKVEWRIGSEASSIEKSTVKYVTSCLPCVSPVEIIEQNVCYVDYKRGDLYAFDLKLNAWTKVLITSLTTAS